MASLRADGNTKKVNSGQLEQTLKCITLVDSNQHQHLPASFGQQSCPPGTTQQCCNVLPGNCPENSVIVREALRMNLPHHLVLGIIQRRVQTHSANYTDLKELVIDLFAPHDGACSLETQEVPMETNQLEEALMMSSLVVKKALQMGVPPHLIKPKVRAKILSNKVGYADVTELLTDLNIK